MSGSLPDRRPWQRSVRAAPAEEEYPIPFAFPLGMFLLSIRNLDIWPSLSSLARPQPSSLPFAASFLLPFDEDSTLSSSVIVAWVIMQVVFTDMLSWYGSLSFQSSSHGT